MKRRDFFKVSSLAIGAAAIGSIPLEKIYSKTSSSKYFSLEIVTDQEIKAIKLVEEFIRTNNLNWDTIKYSEFKLDKSESGDIVLFMNSKLVNYKSSSGKMAENLRSLARQLDLPRIVSEPVRLRFYTQNEGTPAQNFLVFHKDKLIHKINAGFENMNLKIAGTKGDLMLNVNGKKARVVQSSCTHKNCINTGSISLSNETIVCIPNQVLILAE